MKCTACGTTLSATITDLPLKVREGAIVIVKDVPILQCTVCPEYLLEDRVLAKVDEILARTDDAELEIIRYAA